MVSPVTVKLLDPGVAECSGPEAPTPVLIGLDGPPRVSAEDGQ